MYFPYVRGRQYEMLALRELVTQGLLSSKILPVVEPVKLSSTLLSTMAEFVKNKKRDLIIGFGLLALLFVVLVILEHTIRPTSILFTVLKKWNNAVLRR